MTTVTSQEISLLLARSTSELADIAVSALMDAGYHIDGQAGAGPVGQILDAWKRFGEPYVLKSRAAAEALWTKILDQAKIEHPATTEDVLVMAAAADFVREVFAVQAKGHLDLDSLSLHSLLAFCIVLSRVTGSMPWDHTRSK